jgi:hypothetical protein
VTERREAEEARAMMELGTWLGSTRFLPHEAFNKVKKSYPY